MSKACEDYEIFGIDVGAKRLVVANGSGVAGEYENTAVGRRQLIARLGAAERSVRVVLEATGIYFLDLACELAAAGIAVMVVNPKAAHHFAEAMLQRRKDDPVDASMLQAFGRAMVFVPWTAPQPAIFQLRELARHVGRLSKTIAAAKNQLHAAGATRLASPVTIAVLERQIAHDESLIEDLLAEARRLAAADPRLARRLALADSVPGVAERSALLLTGELAPLPETMSARQWVAQAGLDVREERSGTSLNRQPRISKRGNKRLREALFYPALTAARCCPQAAAFVDRLVAGGLTRLQAMLALMRKLLHALHAMWRTDRPFDAAKLFTAA
jgi:transposase